MGDRTRRLVPAVLVSLALFLGLSATGTAAFAQHGDRVPEGTAAAPAVPVTVHTARRGSDVAVHTRRVPHRPAGGTSPLPAALLAGAVVVAATFVRWLRFRPGRAVPTGRGRIAPHGRAPPHAVLPA